MDNNPRVVYNYKYIVLKVYDDSVIMGDREIVTHCTRMQQQEQSDKFDISLGMINGTRGGVNEL